MSCKIKLVQNLHNNVERQVYVTFTLPSQLFLSNSRIAFTIFFDISRINKNDQRVFGTLLACSN